MATRFKDPTMIKEYEAAKATYASAHRDLFKPDGSQHIGSSFASFFWGGFNGLTKGLFNFSEKPQRNTISYAYYCAGRDCATQETSKV